MENSRELNPMCTTCARCGVDCKGTRETVWTGCTRKISQTIVDRYLMNLYAIETGNSSGQCLIFTTKAAAVRWAQAATRWTDAEILEHIKELQNTGGYFSLFPTR